MNNSPSQFSILIAFLAVIAIWIVYKFNREKPCHPSFGTILIVAFSGMGLALGSEIIYVIFFPPTIEISAYRLHFFYSALAVFWFSIDQLSKEIKLLKQKTCSI